MQTISVDEFDRMFDDGEEDVVQYVDWSRAYRLGERRPGGDVFPPAALLEPIDAEADNEGVGRDQLMEDWRTAKLAERAA